MNKITKEVAEEAKDFGIKVIDVRIKKSRSSKLQIARRYLNECKLKEHERQKNLERRVLNLGQTIKSTADKEVAIILAEARKTAQILRGEGDGQRNKIFAEAFGRDPEFFSFYRAMQSYEKSLISGSETSLVLSPDSEFFRYFGESD
jgi:membrane protease subunit HflC